MDLSLFQVPLLSKKIDDSVWRFALHHLSTIPEDAGTSGVATAFVRLRWLVLAEVIRLKWDSKFRPFKFRGSIANEIKTYGLFWYHVLTLINEVFLLKPHYTHPAIWFAQVMAEFELWGLTAESDDPLISKTRMMEQMRSENRALLTLSKNPFASAATKTLIDEAMILAENNDRFRTRTYTPFVKSRMVVVTYASQNGAVFASKNGKTITQNRGRKSNSV